MNYLMLCSLLLAGACGTDTSTSTGTSPDTLPDGGTPGGGPVTPGTDGNTDVCGEAAAHSDLAWIQEHVFTPSCATAMCHSAEHMSVGLSLAAGQAYGNLVNHSASTADGWTRVVPAANAESYLLVALNREPGPMPHDGYMPLGAPPLCEGKLAAIERWIAAGALP
jgi:hypothetical protein